MSLTQYYVSMEKNDYQAQCGRTLLTVTKYIEGEGSLNFKILKALCLSRFSKDEKSFIPDSNFKILGIIRGRFDSIPSFDIDASKHIKSVFDNIVKDDPRYFCIDY